MFALSFFSTFLGLCLRRFVVPLKLEIGLFCILLLSSYCKLLDL